MSILALAPRARSIVNGWETIRYELLNTRLCDLGLSIENSPVEAYILRLYRELRAKKIAFEPEFYLTDGWGCPNEVPVIGIPFYLTDKRLARLEEEQTGTIEDEQFIMMLLRHEAGHAINYAYRLWERPGWSEVFGPFSKPYRDHYIPDPASREFVRHITASRYGRTYAQKHPDEDFAETFAVWLTPRSCWRRKYRNWPVLAKLKYMDKLMRQLRAQPPLLTSGPLCQPIEELTYSLAEHYGQMAERYRAHAQGYVDDRLREAFPPLLCRSPRAAADLIRGERPDLARRAAQWSGLPLTEIHAILDKLIDRAETLNLSYRPKDRSGKVLDLLALVTALAMDFSHTGSLAGNSISD